MGKVGQISDFFRGLNTKQAPEDLLPGECVDCTNLYLYGGELKGRPYLRYLSGASDGVIGSFTSLFWAPNIQGASPDPDAKVLLGLAHHPTLDETRLYKNIWTGVAYNGWEEIGECPGFEFPTGNPLDGSYEQVKWIKWEYRVYLYTPTAMYLTDGSDVTKIESIDISECTWAISEGHPGVPYGHPGFDGTANYIVKLEHKHTGIYAFHKFSDIEITFGTGQMIVWGKGTSDLDLNDYDVSIYRADTLSDGSAESAFAYLLETFTINPDPPQSGTATSFTWYDVYTRTAYMSGETFHEDVLQNTGAGNIDATWYQDRVVWARNRGRLMISASNNPLAIPFDLNDIEAIKQGNTIVNIIEYIGTLIIFTTQGIYHLVGAIADDVLDSNYSIYLAVEDKHFLPVKRVLTVNNYLYVLALDGLYRYDTRNLLPLSLKFPSPFLHKRSTLNVLEVDELRQIILCHFSDTNFIYIYHYEKEFMGENPEAGPWTQWVLEAVKDIVTAYAYNVEDIEVQKFATIARTGQVYQFYSDTATNFEGNYAWSWLSQEFNLEDNYELKKWEEIRIGASMIVYLEIKIPEIFGGTNLAVTGPEIKPVGVRLKVRGVTFQFKLSGYMINSVGGIRDFGIEVTPLGR